MLISLLFNFHLESIAISIAFSSKPIKLIVKALPLVATVSVVISLHSMKLLYFVHVVHHQIEVKSSLSFHFHAVEKEQELRLVSCVKVHLKLWLGVGVDLDVIPTSILVAKVIIVFFDVGAHGVPRSMEVNASVNWSSLIKSLNAIRQTGWNHPILASYGVHSSSRQVKS